MNVFTFSIEIKLFRKMLFERSVFGLLIDYHIVTKSEKSSLLTSLALVGSISLK